MNVLPNLSGDAFEVIFGFLDGFSLCKLWFCGSASMRSKLSNHVKTFELVSEQKKCFQWPKIVNKFVSLRSFSMIISWGHTLTIVGGVDLKDLPRTLKHLVLMFGNGLLSLLKIQNLINNLDESSTVQLSSLPSKNIGALFPELQTLDWGDIFWAGMWPKQIISQVPTLTHLDLLSTRITPLDIRALPPALTSLSFYPKSAPFNCENPELIVWPPHLRALKMMYIPECYWLRNLPSELETLMYTLEHTCQCLRTCGFLDYFSGESIPSPISHDSDSSLSSLGELSISPPNAPRWPPNLTDLQLSFVKASVPSTFFISLPKKLKVLFMKVPQEIDLQSFHLPAGLEHFYFHGFQCPGDLTDFAKYLKVLPRGLKLLSINGNTRNGDTLQLEPFMQLLPKTLSDCRVQLTEPTIHLQEWPAFLVDISICIPEDGLVLKQASFKFVTSVTISSGSGSAEGTRSILQGLEGFKNIRELIIQRKLNAADLELLDCELQHLHLRTPVDLNQVPLSSATKWHRSLQSLHFKKVIDGSFDENTQISFFKSLPPTLEELTLHIVPRVSSDSSSYNPAMQKLNYFTQQLVFPNLPPKLQILLIDVNSFSNDGLQYLPHSLTSMRIAAHQSTYSFLDPNNFSQSMTYFTLVLKASHHSNQTCAIPVDERIKLKTQFYETHPNLRSCAIPNFELPKENDESWICPYLGAIGRAVQTYPPESLE